MASSTIPAAIDALVAGLTTRLAAVGDTESKVVDGFPRFTITNVDFIAIGGKTESVATGEQTAATLGNRKREERYVLRVYCSSSRGLGTDQKYVRDRAFALMAVVEDVCRNDVTLGGAVHTAQVAGSLALNETDFDTKTGVNAEVSFDVACTARI